MELIKPYHKIEYITPNILEFIEKIGRVCYKSEEKITNDSSKKFVENIIKRGHESVLEHAIMTVRFICDRGVTHEIVRHRLCAYSQESTRYCNYKGGVTFIIPCWTNIVPGIYNESSNIQECAHHNWYNSMKIAENNYIELIEKFGWNPQQARSVLPNSLKTELVCTTNIREWRHILKLRCSIVAHPQMKELMIPLLNEVKEKIPILFDDITY